MQSATRARTGRVVLAFAMALLADSLPADEPGPREALEPGETVWSLAHDSGLPVEDLLLLNGLDDPTAVRPEQSILLPEGPAPSTRALEPAPSTQQPPEFIWPLRGVVTSRYGRRGRRLHAGLDIAASRGTIIVAAAAGRVMRAGRGWGRYGKVVLIDHGDGFATLYAHASKVFVKEGEQVPRGTAIAAVGRSGNATGPHLHFEVWGADRALDPLRFLAEPEATARLAEPR